MTPLRQGFAGQGAAENQAVFLSYASQDAESVMKICDALRALGVEVWFDQNELVGGDAWDQKIRRQIKDCALFVPVISANTNARPEGYFRLEWKLAVDRSHLMAHDHPFLFPVVIDDTTDAAARVPDKFREVQWTRLNVKDTPESLATRVAKILGGGGPILDRAPGQQPGRQKKREDPWIARAAVIFGLVVALSAIVRPLWKGMRTGETKPPPAAVAKNSAGPSTPTTAAVAAFPRDPDLKRARQLIYTLDAIPEDLALADDLVKPLLAARPNDPEVVIVAAEVAGVFLTRGFDITQPRRAQAQRLAERAVQLAPDQPDALSALAWYLWFSRTQFGRAEELARRAIELDPKEGRYYGVLFLVLASAKRDADADALGARMAALFPDDPLVTYSLALRYTNTSNFTVAEEWLDRTLALAPMVNAMTAKARFMLEVHGDVDGMKRALDHIPERQRTNARLVNTYAVLATVTGQTGLTRRLLDSITDTWLADGTYIFPKAMLEGDLEQIDGHDGVARLRYEAALKEVRKLQAADPTDLRPVRAELWVQLGLGHPDEARAALQTNLELRPKPYRWTMNFNWWSGAPRACLLLGERTQALALLKEACADAPGRLLLRNLFRVDPKMAPFRDDPEITALLAEPAAKPAAKN